MLRPFAAYVDRLDSAYRDRPYFIGMKARLLAAFCLLLLLFVPVNAAKILWAQPPGVPLRLIINLSFALAALLSLRWLHKGWLELAGSGLVLGAMLPAHAFLFFAPFYAQPLGLAVQLFVFDVVFLLLAIVFASRRIALGVLALIVGSHLAFYRLALHADPLAGSIRFAADTLLRDGLLAIGFVFCLGVTMVFMIEAAHRRSEEALRETSLLNANLERLVSERTRDLEAATLRANEASRAKGDFLANMSHEIRTPLNGIIASADLLQHIPNLEPGASEHVRLISESGELLLQLLGDILDFSKIEAGQLELEKHSFELVPLVSDTMRLVTANASRGGVRLDLAVEPGLPKYFEGDSFRLRQILLNLFSNAIKFTPAGGWVQLTVAAAGGPDDGVRFEVRDTGIGMDEPTIKRVFERFTQADSSTTRRFGGTGLGLAISSRLVGMMGGRLVADSVPGEGSVFYFTLPLTKIDAAPGTRAAPAPRPLSLRLRVLVADDNVVNRKILAAQLEQLDCDYTMTVDGEAVLAALEHEPLPDVILMDCHMPNLDGWEATRRLRRWADDPHATPHHRKAALLPVIALTAAVLPEEQARCQEAGMTAFISKPVKLAGLQRTLLPFATSVEAG
jgi:signal transduction histidine kinase/CheY-like chemotaxis protein